MAAEDREAAARALAAIRVDYEVLDAPLTPAAARDARALRLHERKAGAEAGIPNLSRRLRRRWGSFEDALARSTHAAHGRFSYPRVAHACMEPHTTLAVWDADASRLHLWTSTQAPFFVVKEVAHALGIEEGQVFCHEVAVGGGFGAKSKITEHEVIAALLARKSGRPVRIALSREEEFAFTKTRHAFDMALRLHLDSQGALLGISGDMVVDNGAYDHSGVSVMAAGLKAFGMMYRPVGISVDADLVDTATMPGGQFRGYGSTQTSFAVESLLDEAARQLNLDPVEIRVRNANRAGERTLIGAELASVSLAECLQAASDAIGWRRIKAERRPGRGVGIAAAVHPSGVYSQPGANRSDVAIDLFSDGRVRVRFGGADAGTGQRTILAQIAAHELGVELDRVEVVTMESGSTPFDMGAWSSRGTHYSGHAVRLAAATARERRANFAAEAMNGVLTVECSYVEPSVKRSDPATGVGNYSASYNFAAHAALVDVDHRTGRISLIDYVAAHDIGAPINPLFCHGQIAGGAAMGIGAALGEELIYEQGKLVNGSYIHYALPRSADLPRVRSIIVPGRDARGPYGAKAVGETGVNPPGAAISNAVFDAIGVRIRELPITPDKILTALAAREGRQRRFMLARRPRRWWIQLIRWAYPRGLFQVLHRRIGRLPAPTGICPPAKLETPSQLSAAIGRFSEDAAWIAGGTDMQLQRRQHLVRPARLVSVMELAELRDIRHEADGSIAVGAAVTLADLQSALSAELPVLAEAIATIASPQIREMATVGGNLLQAKRCWFYRNDFPCYKRMGGLAPCYAINGDHRFYHAVIDGHRCQAVTPSDLATVLVALDAHAVIRGAGGEERAVRLSQLYRGPGESVLRHQELMVEVRIPAAAGRRLAAFEKLRLWEGDFAVASACVAAQVDSGDSLANVRVVLGAVAPVPWRALRTERALEGRASSTVLELCEAPALRRMLDDEINASAHPLARNAWKLDAAVGLAEQAAERLAKQLRLAD